MLPLSVLAKEINTTDVQTENDLSEIVKLTEKLCNDLTMKEIKEWAIGQEESWETINDQEILQQTQALETEEDSEESDSETNQDQVKNGEAVAAFQKCLNWAQQNGEPPHHILLLEQMQSNARISQIERIKQRKITEFFKNP